MANVYSVYPMGQTLLMYAVWKASQHPGNVDTSTVLILQWRKLKQTPVLSPAQIYTMYSIPNQIQHPFSIYYTIMMTDLAGMYAESA